MALSSSPVPRYLTLTTPLALSCAAAVATALALGIWLLVLASAQAGAFCDVPLASFAALDGAFFLAAAVCGAIASVAFVWWAPAPEQALARGSLGAGLCSICLLAALLLAWLGVKIYGTVLLFGDGLWTRMNAALEGGEPCAPALYRPLSTFMIISWTLPTLLLGVLVLAALAWSLWEAYVAATRPKRDEDEERNPWLSFEGMRPSWEMRDDNETHV